MIKILLPVDFSKTSSFAVDACIKFASRFNGEVDVLHCIDKKALVDNYLESNEASDFYMDQITNVVNQKLEKISAEFEALNIKCTSINKEGVFLKHLADLHKENNYDFIIMGSHGQSGFKEWALGSNAQKIVRKIPTNVLVIKNEVGELDFSQAVFVTGLDLKDQEPFKKFLNIISKLKVDLLNIMAVDTALYFTQPSFIMREALQDFKEIADGFNVKTHFYSDYSIEAGVRHFVEEKGVSLIGISNHAKNPIQRIFTGSNVEAIVGQSDVPVLTINY